MFKKLSTSYNISSKVGDTEFIRFGMDIEGTWRGITYHNSAYPVSDIQDIWNQIPPELQGRFSHEVMTINSDVYPHIDNGIHTSINVYTITNGYTTAFNKPKEGRSSFKLPNQQDGLCYHFDDVDIVDSFVAQDGDAYLLNVKSLHSVYGGGNKIRQAVVLSSDIPYDELVDILN